MAPQLEVLAAGAFVEPPVEPPAEPVDDGEEPDVDELVDDEPASPLDAAGLSAAGPLPESELESELAERESVR
ncbi:hypothetical protein QTQ03_23315 [Micromonospora sp. WMMA1363]|uniref:hypothetical protein n=1 Tax=Micromonospora sp. WMMA1363 TaxID=3053985 RepID=UPI00259CDE95|nr:hypothetical protein [Micromonospora sp. WMMA1363]MDM4722373.1 hypothetical protein [Micromonospora sp. WMMA1363]